MRGLVLGSLISLLCIAAPAAIAKEATKPSTGTDERRWVTMLDSDPKCFDVALVGKLVRMTTVEAEPLPDGLMSFSTPMDWEFVVEQRLLGDDPGRRITAGISLHAVSESLRGHRMLLFLKRSSRAKRYMLLQFELDLVKDSHGKFVIPMARPYEFNEAAFFQFIPKDYESFLRPIQYRPSAAPWLAEPELDRVPTCERQTPSGELDCRHTYVWDKTKPIDTAAYPWGRLQGGYMLADRGLFVSDFSKIYAHKKCA